MIVRIVDGDTQHMDREALTQWVLVAHGLDVPEITLRRNCRDAIVGHDPATGRVLYDVRVAEALLQSIKLRPTRRGKHTVQRP